MGFLNIGRKDERGRQRRIEHRGKHLRASRTGGVALRAQARAAGVSLTANTAQGFRVSATPLKGTQVGFQNGRFILRGRYGSGPTKLNVAKTGLSVSTRNGLGTFNWLKPKRSSAKILGVQVRGEKAAYLQAVYGVFAVALMAVRLAIRLAAGALRLLLAGAGLLYRLVRAVPEIGRLWRRWRRNARLAERVDALERAIGAEVDALGPETLTAALALIVAAWGRGEPPRAALATLQRLLETAGPFPALPQATGVLEAAADALERCRSAAAAEAHEQDADLAVLGLLARRAEAQLPADQLPEVLLEADELALAQGGRTARQARMLEVLGDFAGLRLQVAEPASEPAAASAPGHAEAGTERIDLNHASVEALQAIPHIGPERAEAIRRLRPIRRVADLEAVDGIGPQRLAEIAEYVAV